MSACKKSQIMTSLETLIFLGLCVLAIVSTWEEIAKYRSGDSSFKRSKGKIAKLPIITICFSPKSVILEYGKHFNISKYKSYPESTKDKSRQNILNIGKNFKEQVDIRQSIDRNDCGKNPSFWKLEILVYFLV